MHIDGNVINRRRLTSSRDRSLDLAMNRSNDGSDVTILKNKASRLLPNADDDIHHCPGQVVGPNDLIGEQHPKNRVDRAQQAVAQIRFLAWLHRIDIRGSEDIEIGRASCRERV